MIISRHLPGAWYAFCLPDGNWGALYSGSHVGTSLGRVELPNGEDVLFLVGTFYDGTLWMAGQGQSSGTAWLWNGVRWFPASLTFGVSPCCFSEGFLYVVVSENRYLRMALDNSQPNVFVDMQIGSQGIRYIDHGVPVTGDATYTNHGATLHEYTVRGDVIAGQGHERDFLVNGRVLEPGDWRVGRFERAGDVLAIACVSFQNHEAALHWLNFSDIFSLPLPSEVPVDPPPVEPPKPVEPPSMPGITDAQFATLERVRAKYPATVNAEQIGAILNEVAWIHRAEGVGMQSKGSGTVAIQPKTGTTIWRGMRFAGNIGQDVLHAATVGTATPIRGTAGPADPATFVAPVQPEGVVEPPPPPPPSESLEDRVAELERRVKVLEGPRHGTFILEAQP